MLTSPRPAFVGARPNFSSFGDRLMNRFFGPIVPVVLVVVATPVAYAACLPASGKITNNAQFDQTTLGSVAMKLGAQNFKCGIVGKPNGFTEYGLPKFIHTIVCDDKAVNGAPQGQVSFDTSVTSLTPTAAPGSCGVPSYSSIGAPFKFEEQTMVIANDPSHPARGIFAGVYDGQIGVEGEFNCQGGIVMKFSGEICI
ncbi:MAG: hypothetical protein JNJ44_03495 [Zoogloeaceae bacterium]|nr:hypothetical protein [Zoogloeaceae bacterium]